MPVSSLKRRAKVRGRHVHLAGQRLDVEVVAEVRADPRQQRGERLRLADGHRAGDVLGLTAVAVRRHDHAPRGGGGDLGTELLAHHVQRRVDGRQRTRRRSRSSRPGRRARRGRHASGKRAASSAACLQWVVQRRPSSSPASPSMKVAEQWAKSIAPARVGRRAAARTTSGEGPRWSLLGARQIRSASAASSSPCSTCRSNPRTRAQPPGTRRDDLEVEDGVVVLGVVGLGPHLAQRAEPERLGLLLDDHGDLLHGDSVPRVVAGNQLTLAFLPLVAGTSTGG